MKSENAVLLFNEAFDDLIDQLKDSANEAQKNEALEEMWALIGGPLGPYADDKPACLRGLCQALES